MIRSISAAALAACLAVSSSAAPAAAPTESKNPKKDIEKYSEAVQRAPEDDASWYNLAFAHHRAEQWDEAAAAIEKATTLNDKSARAWQLRGTIATHRKKNDEAVSSLEKARDLETAGGGAATMPTVVGLAKAYAGAGKWQESADAYKAAYKLVDDGGEKGDLAAIGNQIGTSYLKMGNTEEAVKWFKRSAEKNPDAAAANYNLGQTYRQAQMWQEAADALKKAADLAPNDAIWQFFAGESLMIAGRKQEAKPYLQKYLAADPDGKKAVAKFGPAGKTEIHAGASELLKEADK